MVQNLCSAFVPGMMRVGYSPSLLLILDATYIPIPVRPIIMMHQNTQAAIIISVLKKVNYRCHLKKGVKQTDIKHWETMEDINSVVEAADRFCGRLQVDKNLESMQCNTF